MLYADENSFDIGAKITKTKPVLLPIGAVEAHGPHLPLKDEQYFSVRIFSENSGGNERIRASGFAIRPSLEFARFPRKFNTIK